MCGLCNGSPSVLASEHILGSAVSGGQRGIAPRCLDAGAVPKDLAKSVSDCLEGNYGDVRALAQPRWAACLMSG